MKCCFAVYLLLSLFSSVNASVTELLSSRIWTSVDGKEVDAELIGKTAKTIEIKRKSDRRKFKLPINKLSEEDQEILKNAEEDLVIAAEEWGDKNSRAMVLEPSSLDLARRLGVIEKMGPLMRRSGNGATMNFPVEGIVLGGGSKLGVGAQAKRYTIKSGNVYLRISHTKSVGGKDTRIQQKGQSLWLYKQLFKTVYETNYNNSTRSSSTNRKKKDGWEPLKEIGTVGGNVGVSFSRNSSSYLRDDGGDLSFDRFSIERVGLWDAVVIDVSIKL